MAKIFKKLTLTPGHLSPFPDSRLSARPSPLKPDAAPAATSRWTDPSPRCPPSASVGCSCSGTAAVDFINQFRPKFTRKT
jgi:hypothetical protein